MKNLILLFVFLLSAFITTAQVATTFFSGKDAFKSFPELKQSRSQVLSAKRMPQVDTEKLLKEDRENERLDSPFRIGYGFDVNYTLDDGTWEEKDSMRIWSLKIASPGAYALNFIFDELNLSPDAQLYIFNTEGSMVYGPVTEKQNIEDGVFMTDLVAGDEVTIQLSEPAGSKEKSFLRISKVIHAYKNILQSDAGTTSLRATTASNCYNDMICYPDWLKEADGVALILIVIDKNEYSGSGSLLNNTAQNFKPYFLTAFHLIDTSPVDGNISSSEKTAIEAATFCFHYRYTTCGGSVLNANTTYTYCNAYLRAAWKESDFALLELRTSVSPNLVSFLGWDRSGNIPPNTTCIHHQGGKERGQQIAFADSIPGSNSVPVPFGNGVVVAPINSQWIVRIDDGSLGKGASGSPLFDANRRVIGQVHGGFGDGGCPPYLSAYFGKFSASWTGGGTAATRLSDWLDPLGNGDTITNTYRSCSIQGPDLVPCSGTVSYLLPEGSTNITWSVPPNLQIVSGQGTNKVTVGKASSGTSPSATINATCTYFGTSFNPYLTVSVGARAITSLSSSVTNVRVGGSVNFSASPNFPATEGDYEWMVTPTTGVSQSAWRNTNNITFNTPGSYAVSVRSTSSCTSPGTYTMTPVSVSSSSMAPANSTISPVESTLSSVVVNESQHVNVAFDHSLSMTHHSFSWQLSSLTTGIKATSGHISSKGGALHFSHLPAGIYILKIDTGSGVPETHKIVLK